MKLTHFPFKSNLLASSIALLAACNSITYHPTKTIEKIDPQKGYRIRKCDAAGITKRKFGDYDFFRWWLSRGIFRLWRIRAILTCRSAANGERPHLIAKY